MADFNYYLNRQGSRGKQGIQGEQGFSPVITVATSTLSEYILHIVTQDNEFNTVNLREHKDDLGGTYIRYNRETGVMYAGDADIGTSTQRGLVRFATAAEVASGDVEEAVTSVADVTDMINARNYDAAISQVQQNLDDAVIEVEADINSEMLARQAADGVLQSSIDNLRNSLVNYVDLTSTQTISGIKRFNYLRANSIQSLYNAHTLISYDEDTDRLTLGGASAREVRVTRNGNTYTNVDTGNLSDYIDIATTQRAGIVKPDGTSITVDNDGTIHSTAGTYELPTASTTTKGGIKVDGTTVVVNDETLSAVPYQLPTASDQVKGGVKVDGTSITINNEIISATPYTLPTASTQTLGGVKVDGTTITIDNNGVISGASTYELPTASTTTLGGVKIDGQTINIDANGVISASTGAVIDDNNISTASTYSSSKIETRLNEVRAIAEDNIDGGSTTTQTVSIQLTYDGDSFTQTTQATGFDGSTVTSSFTQTAGTITHNITSTQTLGETNNASAVVVVTNADTEEYNLTFNNLQKGVPQTQNNITVTLDANTDYKINVVDENSYTPVQTPNLTDATIYWPQSHSYEQAVSLRAGTYKAIRRRYPNITIETVTLNDSVVIGYTSTSQGELSVYNTHDNVAVALTHSVNSETGTDSYGLYDLAAVELYMSQFTLPEGYTFSTLVDECSVGVINMNDGDNYITVVS